MNILVQRSKKLKNTLNISLFMKTKVFEKNFPNWNIENIIDQLDNFISIYEKRPIKNNKGGMLFSHMFFSIILMQYYYRLYILFTHQQSRQLRYGPFFRALCYFLVLVIVYQHDSGVV